MQWRTRPELTSLFAAISSHISFEKEKAFPEIPIRAVGRVACPSRITSNETQMSL
jgi:hypothetical protein